MFFLINYDKILYGSDNMEKNKSFVKIDESIEDQIDIIDPLKKFEYQEPPKKKPFKQFFLILGAIMVIIGLIIFINIINTKDKEKLNNNESKNYDNYEIINKTDEEIAKNELKEDNNEQTQENTENIKETPITEQLICEEVDTQYYLEVNAKTTVNFSNNQLKNTVNEINVKLLDESSREYFDQYVSIMQAFLIYLNSDSNYYKLSDNEYYISIKTTYSELTNSDSELELQFNDTYDTALEKLTNSGQTCKKGNI